MPSPSSKKLGLVFFTLLVLTESGFSDSLFLKNGREIKGDIIQNDSSGILIEYFVTPTIKDQKIFSKEEIDRIVATPADDKAFNLLGSRATPPPVLDTSFYDTLIEKKLPDFFKRFPYSRHITELREDMRSLTAERDRVNAGDRRIDGSWITSAQITADPYQAGARISFSEVKLMTQGDDPVASLKAYELLEKNYPGSSVMPDALDLIPNQMDLLQGKINSANQNLPILAKKRQTWIDAAPSDQAKEIKAALEKDDLNAKSTIAGATKDGSKFFPVFPNSKDSLDQLQALLIAEKTRLASLRAIPMRDSINASHDASKLIDIGKLKEAQIQLDNAAKLWPVNAEIPVLKLKLESAEKLAKTGTSPSPSISPKPTSTR